MIETPNMILSYLSMDQIANAFPGSSTSEVRKKLRYIFPPSNTDPRETPKYT